ncbi:hypothetical protein BKK40_22780 [Bacillus cereus]|nr:hypothetical protein BKK40_22780 [Bacillus cereus]
MRLALFEVLDTSSVVEELTNKVERQQVGVITNFIGTIRELTKGKQTLHLVYKVYKLRPVKSLIKLERRLRKNSNIHRKLIERLEIVIVIAIS